MLSYVSQAHYAHSIILCLIEWRLTFNINDIILLRLSFHTDMEYRTATLKWLIREGEEKLCAKLEVKIITQNADRGLI